MKRRPLIRIAIAYFFATLFAAWFAYGLGANRTLHAASLPGSFAGPFYDGFIETTEAVWDCTGFRGFPGLLANHRERACGPGRPLKAAAAKPLTYNGHLQAETVRAIAGARPRTVSGVFEVPAPTGVAGFPGDGSAPGPGPDPLFGPFAPPGTNPGQSIFGPPGGGPGPALPGVILSGPGGFPGGGPPLEFPPDGEDEPETPPLVTPLPGAFPLLLTGFCGLAAARRRQRRHRPA